jgi:hypothetical protein
VAGVAGYTCVWRPVATPHGYPALVFDSQYRLDLPLISFIKQAQQRLSSRSVRVYVYALLPFLRFVERTPHASNTRPAWNTTPERVRALAAQYLEEELGCVIRQHRLGFELVSMTARSPSNVGVFIASVRLFFNVMREIGCYAGESPLIDIGSQVPVDLPPARAELRERMLSAPPSQTPHLQRPPA